MGRLDNIINEAKEMQAIIERQRRELEKTFDNVMKLRAENDVLTDIVAEWKASCLERKAENEKQTAALGDIRELCTEQQGVDETIRAIIDKVTCGSSTKTKTLKDIREACPVGLTIEAMDHVSRTCFSIINLSYSEFEAGNGWLCKGSEYTLWIAKLFGVTPAEAFAANQASCAEAKEGK